MLSLSLSLSLSLFENQIFGEFFWRINPTKSTNGFQHAIWINPNTDLDSHVLGGYTDKCSWCPARSFLIPDSLIHQVCLSSINIVHFKRYEFAVPHRFTVQKRF